MATSCKTRGRVENIQEWEDKPLYGQFARQTEDQRNEENMNLVEERKS